MNDHGPFRPTTTILWALCFSTIAGCVLGARGPIAALLEERHKQVMEDKKIEVEQAKPGVRAHIINDKQYNLRIVEAHCSYSDGEARIEGYVSNLTDKAITYAKVVARIFPDARRVRVVNKDSTYAVGEDSLFYGEKRPFTITIYDDNLTDKFTCDVYVTKETAE